MTELDIPAVLTLLHASPGASTWPSSGLKDLVEERKAWIAELNNQIVGFIAGMIAADEYEILNLAVAWEHRRKGVAAELVRTAMAWSREAGATTVYLEVRASNYGAYAFYSRLGFSIYGRRPNYYRDSQEDALLLSFAQP